MKLIYLTQGKVAAVSEEDYEFLMDWKWLARKGDSGIHYAMRNQHLCMVAGKQKQVHIHMHRLILERMLGHSDFEQVDHIDGDGLNNTRKNLRPVTHKQNRENIHGAYKNSKSGIRGVCWSKWHKKWMATIRHDKKTIHLGFFDDVKQAEVASIAARNQYFTHHTG